MIQFFLRKFFFIFKNKCLAGSSIRPWMLYCTEKHLFWSILKNSGNSQRNLFHTTDLFLYPLETSKNIWLSDVFRGYRKRPAVMKTCIVTTVKRCSWIICDKVFKNGPRKICGGQPLKNLKWHGLLKQTFFKDCLPQILPGSCLNTSSHLIHYADLRGVFSTLSNI